MWMLLEGLNSMVQKIANEETIRGLSLYKNGPHIAHLFFADNSLLFSCANLDELITIQEILTLYKKSFRSTNKSWEDYTFFCKSVSERRKGEIINFLWVPKIREYEKYLVLPTVVGRNKKGNLNYIKGRVWNKSQGWKEKLLSQVGRKILLKAMVQAIPTFTMSCFKLPLGLCHEIEMLIRKFW